MAELFATILTGPLLMPSAVAPELGPGIDQFFQRALARTCAQRFQSVRELSMEFLSVAGVCLDSRDWAEI
jgi:hypothetical protein